MQFAHQIPQAVIEGLEAKALRLTEEIDRATSLSEKREIRNLGGQLIERIMEWVEEIKDLRQTEDEDIHDVIQSFESRLAMASRMVRDWPGVTPQKSKRRRRKAA